MRYWVCQSCKSGHVNSTQPRQCPDCGMVGGDWKWSAACRMNSFRMYLCSSCGRVVEERCPPSYGCDICGEQKWTIFKTD